MKQFATHTLAIPHVSTEFTAFKALLASKPELSERDEILPFFKGHLQLGSFISTYIPDIANPDLLATEYDLFGDFACDLAVGDSKSHTFLFVEFEDAKRDSLFVSNGKKVTPEWSPRLEHGFSQVVDWFWKLSDMEKSDEYENRFGARHVSIHGLVVVGRDQQLLPRERARLRWRQDHTIIHSKLVSVITFDQLVRDIEFRLTRYPAAAQAVKT